MRQAQFITGVMDLSSCRSLFLGKGVHMGNVQDAFKYNRPRKNVIIGGAVILICITARRND
jgi:hypothetical protein